MTQKCATDKCDIKVKSNAHKAQLPGIKYALMD